MLHTVCRRLFLLLYLLKLISNRLKVKALQDFQHQKFRILEDFVATTQAAEDVSASKPDSPPSSLSRADCSTASRRTSYDYRSETSYGFILGTLFIGTKASSEHGEWKRTAQSEERYIRLTTKILRRVFEVSSTKSYGLWQHCFRSYRTFDFDDPICLACVFGDVELVKRLCVGGQATPYDTTLDGWGLLHVSLFLITSYDNDD